MCESTQKSNPQHRFPVIIVDRLREKYGVSGHFIRMSIKGDRQSETSEKIKKDYNRVMSVLKKSLKTI